MYTYNVCAICIWTKRIAERIVLFSFRLPSVHILFCKMKRLFHVPKWVIYCSSCTSYQNHSKSLHCHYLSTLLQLLVLTTPPAVANTTAKCHDTQYLCTCTCTLPWKCSPRVLCRGPTVNVLVHIWIPQHPWLSRKMKTHKNNPPMHVQGLTTAYCHALLKWLYWVWSQGLI